MTGLSDLTQHIIDSHKPTVCLDTCTILDIARDPQRNSVTPTEHAAWLRIYKSTSEANLNAIVNSTVISEFSNHVHHVQNECHEAVLSILREGQTGNWLKLQEMSTSFDINFSDLLDDPIRYSSVASDFAKALLSNSSVLDVNDDIIGRAKVRVQNQRAPSHRAKKDSFADCVILESYLDLFRSCRKHPAYEGVPMVFVSSNTTDFTSFPNLLHEHIAPSFERLKVRYASNMTIALEILETSSSEI